MNERLGGVGQVIVGNVAYPNSWAEPGKTYRQVTCPICLDTGREFTDDGPLGPVCDCTFGAAIADLAADCGVTIHRKGAAHDTP